MTKLSTVDQIYMDLRGQIIKGQLVEGTKLGERALCERYNTSRTPIREAIKRLEREGWVYAMPKSGTFVSPIESKDIINSHELRLIIEPQALVIAMPKMERSDIDFFNKSLRDMKESIDHNDIEKFLLIESGNHKHIVKKTGNELMERVVLDMYNHILRLGSKSAILNERKIVSVSEWSNIVRCIEKNDVFNGSMYLRQHLMNSSQAYSRQTNL